MIDKTYWGREYKKISNIIPIDDPFRKIKVRMLKQYIVGNFILLILMIMIDIMLIILIIITSKYTMAILIPFTVMIWLGNFLFYIVIRNNHHLLTIKKKYSLGNIISKK